MSLPSGARLGPYQVIAPLGAGGMGEVYRATDTRLGRDVALKLLPPEFASDPDRLARFEREAKLLASLQHPNVATLFGLEETDGRRVLAMELVAGEDLRERLVRGPIPVDEALDVAKQIAEALEDAHEHGIVHRDLKPANVKLTPDGKVKVLDFGLAKAWSGDSHPVSGSGALSQSPTLAHTGTAAGLILGTAAYMSPEQARGKAVDKRADIWAFGVVLFEMLTGRRLFDGETVTDVLAAVVTREPDYAGLPVALPPAVRQLLQRCLRKDPKRRLRDIGEARVALDEAASGGDAGASGVAQAGAPDKPAAAWRRVLPWAVAAFALALAGLGQWRAPRPQLPALRKLTIPIRDLQVGIPTPPALSPDGRRIAYVAGHDLWLRDLDQLEPRKLAASVSPTFPFWSPDSGQVAFIADQKLWRVAAVGGQPVLVAEATFPRGGFTPGGVWLPDDTIVFAPAANGTGLVAVPARGGAFTTLLERGPDESDFHKPSLLPGGGGIVFVVDPNQGLSDSIAALSGGKRKTILQEPGQELNAPVYSPSGHLLFVRENREGSAGWSSAIWAAPFSLETLETTGAPFPVAQHAHWPSLGADGTLVYAQPRAAPLELVFLGADGRSLRTIGPPLAFGRSVAISPDGTRVAASGPEGIFVRDLRRGTHTRLTFDDRTYRDVVWHPDGETALFRAQQGGNPVEIVAKRADGSGEPRTLAQGEWPSLSPDGKWVMFQVLHPGTGGDLYYLPFDGSAKPAPFLEDSAHATTTAFSPDGRFVAITAQAPGSDRSEIFLRPFPPAEGVWQVSSSGGARPRWSRAGDRLFYLQGNDLMEVEVKLGKTPWLGTPRARIEGGPARLLFGVGYDVAPDGSGFVAIREVEDPKATIPALTVVQSWFEEFRAGSGK